jgi:hypothetical protein
MRRSATYIVSIMERTEFRHGRSEVEDLVGALNRRLRSGFEPWAPGEFDELALAIFGHQYAACPTYRAFCDSRGADPVSVEAWQDVPAVPARAFKHFRFRSLEREPDDWAVFRTSGTTQGLEARGAHEVPRLSLYRSSLLEPFRRALMPSGEERVHFVSFIPRPDEAPESSLSFMVGAAAEVLATRVDWIVTGQGQMDHDRLARVLRDASEPILLLSTAAALVHALDGGCLGVLPPGSRVMETGGFKGAHAPIPRVELYRRVSDRTAMPVHMIVNEYGMTELLSQLYEQVLVDGEGRTHMAPPWLRVRALDPVSLEPQPEGSEGVLAFFDLANLGSVSHVLTEDFGSVRDGRLTLTGRLPGAEPRGCSRAMDSLMSAVRERG